MLLIKSEEDSSNLEISKNTPINQIKNYHQEDKIENKDKSSFLELFLNKSIQC